MYCIYGKNRKGWNWCYLRKTNGMVPLTKTLGDRLPSFAFIPFYRSKVSDNKFTTFIWTYKNGVRETFG